MLRLTLLCVFLQTALTKSVEGNYDLDLEDVAKNSLISLNNAHATFSPIITTTETNDQLHSDSSNDSSNDSSANLTQNRRALVMKLFKHLITTTEKPVNKLENLSHLLQKLVVELNSFNKNFKPPKKSKKYALRGHSKKQKRRYRVKRNVINNGNETTENITVVNNNNVTISNSSNSNDLPNNGDIENNSAFNKTTPSVDLPIFLQPNSTQPTDILPNGRRSIILYKSSPILKEKLLIYLEKMFNDIEQRIKPLKEIKIMLSDAISYRIGYVIANIDTLQVQLKKTQTEMAANKNMWPESKVIELFNKLKASNDVVSNLLDILSSYVPQSTQLNSVQ